MCGHHTSARMENDTQRSWHLLFMNMLEEWLSPTGATGQQSVTSLSMKYGMSKVLRPASLVLPFLSDLNDSTLGHVSLSLWLVQQAVARSSLLGYFRTRFFPSSCAPWTMLGRLLLSYLPHPHPLFPQLLRHLFLQAATSGGFPMLRLQHKRRLSSLLQVLFHRLWCPLDIKGGSMLTGFRLMRCPRGCPTLFYHPPHLRWRRQPLSRPWPPRQTGPPQRLPLYLPRPSLCNLFKQRPLHLLPCHQPCPPRLRLPFLYRWRYLASTTMGLGCPPGHASLMLSFISWRLLFRPIVGHLPLAVYLQILTLLTSLRRASRRCLPLMFRMPWP